MPSIYESNKNLVAFYRLLCVREPEKMIPMNGWRVAKALLIGLTMFVISFVLTNWLYIKWAVWRYPETNSMAGLPAFFLSLIVAPICALVSAALSFWLMKPAKSD